MLPILCTGHPRLLLPCDDPDWGFPAASDARRRRILANIVSDCELYAGQRPWRRIPRRPDSPHPYHQLYLTFYTGMQATALLEHYAFAFRVTGDRRWLQRARVWLRAAVTYDHDDEVEEHFYTANRYMQAIAIALDLLHDELSAEETRDAQSCLISLLTRWRPDVESQRHTAEGGHHAVVDNGHFGVAALHLLGKHEQAQTWVGAVIDRFRAAIMPHGCGQAGEPIDGPSFWPWENLWMLQFVDALRHVTGVDLTAEFPTRLRRPLTWFRDHLATSTRISDRLYTPANANVLLGSQLDACSPALLRLAQEAGDGDLRDAALAVPRLGRLYRFGAGVKGSTAECMIAYGPYAYCYYDPSFEGRPARRTPPLARKYSARYGRSAILRTGRDTGAAVLCVSGYDGGTAHGFMNLHLQWAGHPVLQSISALEAQPVVCGSLPCVGGQNEIVAVPGQLEIAPHWQRLRVRSPRCDHEYWLLPGSRVGESPIALIALRRRRRRVRIVRDPTPLFRLDSDALRVAAPDWFSPNGGTLRLRARLRDRSQNPRVLFNAGLGVGGVGGAGVNTFALVVEDDGSLRFTVQSQRGHTVTVRAGRMKTGRWHDITIGWSGFNRVAGSPRLQIQLDDALEALDDPAAFGEMGADSIGLASRARPRTFYIRPHSHLAFGGTVQTPGLSGPCDLSHIQLQCPGRRRLRLDATLGWGPETGAGELAYKLNPVELRSISTRRARCQAGAKSVEMRVVGGGELASEEVPYAPAGLAAGSLKSFIPGGGRAATRVVATTEDDVLVIAIGQRSARVESGDNELLVRRAGHDLVFGVTHTGPAILQPR
ncbi:MAG: hypothetical protein VX255_01650 [Candidatus Latescibacterota bacterium]|nr:hypothetical protein [Candidatus Latescibacterota bacterium]